MKRFTTGLLMATGLGLQCLASSSTLAQSWTTTSVQAVLTEAEIAALAEKVLQDQSTLTLPEGKTLTEAQINDFAKTISGAVKDLHVDSISGDDLLAISKQISETKSSPYYGVMDDQQIKLLSQMIGDHFNGAQPAQTALTTSNTLTLSEEQIDAIAAQVSEQVIAKLQPSGAASTQPATPAEAATLPETTRDVATYKDWTVGCEPAAGNKEQCFIHQTVSDDSGRPVLQTAIGDLPNPEGKKQPTAVFTVPLGIDLRSGVAMIVDGNTKQGIRFPFEQCNPIGCNAVLPLDNTRLGSFKKGNKVTLLLDGDQLELTLSLQGFTAGLDKAQSLSK